MPPGTTAIEQRTIASHVPTWNASSCTQCNICAFVCPHAAIRPVLATPDELSAAPAGFNAVAVKGSKSLAAEYKYRVQVSPHDCTGARRRAAGPHAAPACLRCLRCCTPACSLSRARCRGSSSPLPSHLPVLAGIVAHSHTAATAPAVPATCLPCVPAPPGCELCVHVCPDEALTPAPIADILAPEAANWCAAVAQLCLPLLLPALPPLPAARACVCAQHACCGVRGRKWRRRARLTSVPTPPLLRCVVVHRAHDWPPSLASRDFSKSLPNRGELFDRFTVRGSQVRMRRARALPPCCLLSLRARVASPLPRAVFQRPPPTWLACCPAAASRPCCSSRPSPPPAVPAAAHGVQRRVRGLRRDAVREAADADVWRAHGGRQRDRLQQHLGRQRAVQPLHGERTRRALSGLHAHVCVLLHACMHARCAGGASLR